MSREISVKLADRTYTVRQLAMKPSRAWRKKLEAPFGELVAVLENADNLELMGDKGLNLASIGGVVRTFSGTLLGSIDLLMDLLFEYSPALAADRETIEENAFDDEALAAFAEVLKLAYPFGTVLATVTGSRPAAPTQNQTGQSSS